MSAAAPATAASAPNFAAAAAAGSVATAARVMEMYPLDAHPTWPTVLLVAGAQKYFLPVQRLEVDAELHVATAFVRISGRWRNVSSETAACEFLLPVRSATVTRASMSVGGRLFDSLVIPTQRAQELASRADAPGDLRRAESLADRPLLDQGGGGPAGVDAPDYGQFVPELFRLPVPDVAPGEDVVVTVVYLETLQYKRGAYHFTLPLKFRREVMPAGVPLREILRIAVAINSVTRRTKYECYSHELDVVKNEPPRLELEAVNIGKLPKGVPLEEAVNSRGEPRFCTNDVSVNFHMSYSVSSEEILTTLIKEVEAPAAVSAAAAGGDAEEAGTFLLFVTPPSASNANRIFSRNLVFLLDRSGSMNGRPFVEATRALGAALGTLRPQDSFTIIAFDHRCEFFERGLVRASPENLERATKWVAQFSPERGGTDIQTPLQWALNALEEKGAEAAAAADGDASARALPFVVLLTDGCVANEREICHYANGAATRTRILTFGIGIYCNWFFLKLLAQIGRGFFDVAAYSERIYEQVVHLLNMAAIPVITNVALEIPGVRKLDLYPFPIPDLFMGAPLVVAGKYQGPFPRQITVRGVLADGSAFQSPTVVRQSDVIPVSRLFLKQRIDLLTAQAWMKESKELEEEVVDLSCTHRLPSAFTTMVTFRADPQRIREIDALQGDGGVFRFSTARSLTQVTRAEKAGAGSGAGAGPAAGPAKDPRAAQAPAAAAAASGGKAWYRDPKKLAGLAVGNAVVVGAAAFSFGDAAATLSNMPAMGLGSFDVGFGGECCGCDCGDCGDCGDCLSC